MGFGRQCHHRLRGLSDLNGIASHRVPAREVGTAPHELISDVCLVQRLDRPDREVRVRVAGVGLRRGRNEAATAVAQTGGGLGAAV